MAARISHNRNDASEMRARILDRLGDLQGGGGSGRHGSVIRHRFHVRRALFGLVPTRRILRPNAGILMLALVVPIGGTSAGDTVGRYLGEPPARPSAGEVEQWRRAGLASGGGTGYRVSVSSREEVRRFYTTVYMASSSADPGWTGDIATCMAGTTTWEFRDAVVLRINYYRAMAGVPAGVVFADAWNDKAQQAALIMSSNDRLSHSPPSTWRCYTAGGGDAAGKSNLSLGDMGVWAMDGYIEDYGANNEAVGHRRWLLYPQTETMGSGDVAARDPYSAANATWVMDGRFQEPRPAVRDAFVAWPPPGYVPYQVVFPRWSFSYDDADFNQAVISMTGDGLPVAVTVYPVADGYGENTLVWVPAGMDPNGVSRWPKPDVDTPYTVTIENVIIDGQRWRFDYTVWVMDPAVTGPDTVFPAVSGSTQPAVNRSNAYTFNAVPGATGYQWRQSRRAARTATEGAETGLTDWAAQTTPGYAPVVTDLKASGTRSFHLAQPAPVAQTLTWSKVLLPGTNSQMRFKSRLSWATPGQQARVQVSADDGSSWQDVHTQNGVGEGESNFTTRTVSLAPFARRTLLVRFRYEYLGGSYYNQTNSGVGWHFDDLSFSDTEELTQTVVSDVGEGTGFAFVPGTAAAYALDVRAKVYGRFNLEWGPVFSVTAGDFPLPVLRFTGPPAVQGGQVRADFQVVNYRSSLILRLWRAPQPAGPWQVDTQAVLTTIVPNSSFRFSSPLGGAQSGCFRIRAD